MNKKDTTIKDSFKVVQNPKNPFEKYDEPEEVEPEEIEEHEETVLEKAAEDLKLNLPQVNLPLGLKIVALLTLVGGLGTLGNLFANIFDSSTFSFKNYILQLIGGILFIAISYGIIKRQNWATWLYGALVILALFINWPFALLPAAVVVYMYFNHKYLYPSVFDRALKKLSELISKQAQ